MNAKTKNYCLNIFFVMFLSLLVNETAIAKDNSTFPLVSNISFPDEKYSATISPNGEFKLLNIDSGKDSHDLYLVNLKENKKRKIYEYDRSIGIIWSSNGNRIILNDYGGSNFSNVIIFDFANKKFTSINIQTKLKQNKNFDKKLFGNNHFYIEGDKWIDNNTIVLRISGYGDNNPDGFAEWYQYVINGEFKFLKKE